MLMFGGLVLLAAMACLGYGLAALRLAERLRPGLGRAVTVGDLGLLGYAVLGLLATMLHVFVPLGGVPAAAACLAGIGLLLVQWRGLARQSGAFGWRMAATLVLLVAACLRLGAMIPGSTSGHFDTGLYHLQAVRQAMEFPLILGSANIHMRFGYNSSVFPTAALLSGGLPGLAGAITTNALMMVFVILAVAQRALSRGDGAGLRSTLFGLLAVLLALFTPLLILRVWAGTPNSDIPSALMALYAFHLALRLSDLGGVVDAAAERGGTAALLAVVVGLAVTLKLSALPVVLLMLLPLLAWRRGWIGGRDIGLGVGGALAIGLPWLAQGIATSGCLAYPQPSTCLPVPWRINITVAQSDMDWMRAWARRPDAPPERVLADWSWFPDWIARLDQEPSRVTFLLLGGVVLVLLAARLLLGRRLVIVADLLPRAARRDMLLLQAIAVLGIAFWFVTAPLVRYGQGWLVLPLLLAIAQAAPVGWGGSSPAAGVCAILARPRWRTGAALALAAATVVSLAGQPLRRLLDTRPVTVPEVAVARHGDLAGIPIHVPRDGGQCWDAPRLCTPNLRDGLVATPFLWSWMVRDPS
ncbi:hypothetical protein AAFN86_16785 [Roseomonas sp. CAU 1739]|uniref:LIC_10190 family membrane protein n=1 Tax=Roseomonas sp. CAU 1739 TaxID=3140364 RepID=UPI00325BA8D1